MVGTGQSARIFYIRTCENRPHLLDLLYSTEKYVQENISQLHVFNFYSLTGGKEDREMIPMNDLGPGRFECADYTPTPAAARHDTG